MERVERVQNRIVSTGGRPKKITENMWLAVKAKKDETSGMNQQAIVKFLWTAFRLKVDRSTVRREIKRRDWSGCVAQVIAKERKPYLFPDVGISSTLLPRFLINLTHKNRQGRD